MDRDTIVKICNAYYLRGDVSLVQNVLTEYCLEHNKNIEYISEFISIIFSTLSWKYYFEYALDYYKRKYEIHELWIISSNNLNNQRKLLLIF